MDRGPIFVGGLDRSGKTLMRLSLSSHPNISMTRRTYMWTHVYNRYGDLARPENFERCLAALLRRRHMAALQPDPDRIRREFGQGAPTYGRLFALFHQHYAERVGKPRWGDQLGLVERYADQIFAAYPNARMIHMVRDPRERFAAATSSAQRHAGKIGGATARWRHSMRLAQRNQRRYPDRYTIVRYEALLARRQETLQEVCAFIGEPFAPAMLTLEDAMRFGDGDDDTQDTGTAHVHPAISKREVAFVQACARREMAAYGYQPAPIQLSLSDRLLLYCIDWPANLARMVAWRALGSTKE